MTNIEGQFNLTCLPTSTLVTSFIGYATQEIPVNNQATLNITLTSDINQLNEVMVTAFGIEGEKKALGYSVQIVSGEDLVESRTSNLVNAMLGKVAREQGTSSNDASGSSSRIPIRGAHSIGSSSQSLFVVDGVSIDNGNYGYSTSIDYGNGAAAINPDDSASLSVLKSSCPA